MAELEVESDAKREQPGADALIGTVVNGRFHIVRRIARGGMGSVYFATQAPLSRAVAVKVLHVVRTVDAESDDGFRRRFLREASILAKLQHPNIVTLLDYGQIANLPNEVYFMAMEYLRGQTLAQRFKTQGRLSTGESIRLARQIGRGLREAHRGGFIHRDLKPSNIMLVPEDDKNDIVKLVDFGIGKIIPGQADPARDSADLTRAGLLLGSPRYMSPEQIRSQAVEPRTDLYGLGVILFQALTGRVPFEGGTSFDLMLAHCMVVAPQLSDVCPGQVFPASLSRLVAALLQKQPSNRPTVDEFLERLAAIEGELFGSLGAVPSQPPSSSAASLRVPAVDAQASRRFAPKHSTPPAGAAAVVMGSTMPALSASRPEPPAPGGRKTVAVLAFAMLGALALCLPLGRVAVTGQRSKKASASSAGVPAHPGPSSDAPSAVGSPAAFTLTVDSVPPGATVTEGGMVAGVTPLVVSVARDSVTTGPRRFVLQAEGYSPYVIEQADSDAAVHVSALLSARPRAGVAPWRIPPAARTSGRSGGAPPSSDEPSDRLVDGKGLEIRLRR